MKCRYIPQVSKWYWVYHGTCISLKSNWYHIYGQGRMTLQVILVTTITRPQLISISFLKDTMTKVAVISGYDTCRLSTVSSPIILLIDSTWKEVKQAENMPISIYWMGHLKKYQGCRKWQDRHFEPKYPYVTDCHQMCGSNLKCAIFDGILLISIFSILMRFMSGVKREGILLISQYWFM